MTNARTKKFKPYSIAFLVILVTLVILVIVVVLGIVVQDEVAVLQMTDNKNNLLYHMEVNEGDSFDYFSIHSVSGTTLLETIVIEENCFVTKKARYEDQSGAGLPEYAYDESEFYIEEGFFVIDDLDRINESLIFQVEEEYDNTIYIHNENIPLFSFFERGQGVVKFEILMKNRIELYFMNGAKNKS